MVRELRIRAIHGRIVSVIAERAAIDAFREVVGSISIESITHDELRAFREAKGRPQNAVKRVVEKLRSHNDIQNVLNFVKRVAGLGCPLYIGDMDDYSDGAAGLVNAMLAADPLMDDIVVVAYIDEGGYDAARYSDAKRNGLLDVYPVGGGVAVVHAARGRDTLPLVVGVDVSLDALPERLRSNLAAGKYRGKGSYGTNTAYIKVVGGLELYGRMHRDPAVIEVSGRPCLALYGDTLNGLATVIKGIVLGNIDRIMLFDFA